MNRKYDGKLLVVQNLTIQIQRGNERFFPIQDVSFEIDFGQIMALVGESGSGKTLSALSLLGLLPKQATSIHGDVFYKGQRVTESGDFTYNHLRGNHIVMLFQNAVSALNPVFKAGQQLTDVMKTQRQLSSTEIKQEILTLFDQVGLKEPERVYRSYPHQLSGGMAQRVMIAMALSCRPELIIADEPTTALDAMTQLHIMQLISSLQRKYQFSMFLISHDLNVVASLAEYVMVMRQGRIVEANTTASIFDSAKHHYTQALIDV